jgi:hypothetical protein
MPRTLFALLAVLVLAAPAGAQESQYVWWGAKEIPVATLEEDIVDLENCIDTTRPPGELRVYEAVTVISQTLDAGYDSLGILGGFYSLNEGPSHLIVYMGYHARSWYWRTHELFHYVSEMHNGPKFELLLEYCVGPEPEETGGA